MDRSTPLVFLHAFPLNAAMWEPQMAAMDSRKTLTPNFPGFGGRPVTAADLDRFTAAVIGDMDVAGIRRAVVVGLSMGGYVAFRLHALAPERVAGLVLADTRAGADDDAARARRTDQASRSRQNGLDWLDETLLPMLVGETTRREKPGVVADVRAMIAQSNPEGVARALEAMRDRPDSTPQLSTIEVPAMLLVGEEDTLTPVGEAEVICRGVQNGHLSVLPRAGHLSNLETPDSFNEALLSFLGG